MALWRAGNLCGDAPFMTLPPRDGRRVARSGSASGLPGPKCFRMTSGSVSLVFSTRTPACAASKVTKSSSSVICPNRIIDGVDDAVDAERAVPLREDQAVGGGVADASPCASAAPSAPSPNSMRRAVADPLLAVAVRLGLFRPDAPASGNTRFELGELGIHVRVPVEHADDVVEIVMALFRTRPWSAGSSR